MKQHTALCLVLALVGTACSSSSGPVPTHPPGQPPPGHAPAGHAAPGYPAPGYPAPGHTAPGYAPPGYGQPRPVPALGTAWTPFGELLLQLPPILASLPALAPWAWPPPAQAAPPPQTGPPQGVPPVSSNGWPSSWVAFEDEVLQRTNAQRAVGATCGGQALPPVPAVGPHPQLRAAARGHAGDMARRDYFDHETPEGYGPMQRAQAAGYMGHLVGENIAAGQRTPAEVVAAWVESPGHCVNLMEPRFRYLGVGFLIDSNDRYGEYWVQNFGS